MEERRLKLAVPLDAAGLGARDDAEGRDLGGEDALEAGRARGEPAQGQRETGAPQRLTLVQAAFS